MATIMHLIIKNVVYFLRDSRVCMGAISMRNHNISLEKINFHLIQNMAVILNYITKDRVA